MAASKPFLQAFPNRRWISPRISKESFGRFVRFQRVTRVLNLFLQLCIFVVLAAPEPETRTISRAPCTRYCRFEASEPIPFPGPDTIFSSRCGAISRRLRFQIPNGCRQQIASPHSVLQAASKRPRPPLQGRPEELKKDCSTNSASPNQNAQKSTPPVSAENRAQGATFCEVVTRRPLGVAFRAGRSPTLSNKRLADE
jgi:hypothetical protein